MAEASWHRWAFVASLGAAILAGGCESSESAGGNSSDGGVQGEGGAQGPVGPQPAAAPLQVSESDPPLADLGEVTFYGDVAYDDEALTVFDILLPESSEPTPLILYMHGGGFNGGDKQEAYEWREQEIRTALAAGVAFATSNYRLLQEVDDRGVIKPLTDSKRCLQMLRHHAEQFNIDPERVALMGTSAGGGTALWLGTHDEMANPTAEDLVLRESTRVNAVAAWETQATYDLVRWVEDVYPEYNFDLVSAAEMLGQGDRLLSFYAIRDSDMLDDPDVVAYRQEVDILGWMDGQDAPFWVENSLTENAFPSSADIAFHHPRHAMKLKEDADAAGLTNVAYVPKLDYEDPSGVSAIDFVLERL